MGGEILISRIQIRLVTVGLADGAFQIVGDDDVRATAEKVQRAHLCADPVGERLRPGRLGIGVVGRPEHRYEDLRGADLPAAGIDHRCRLPGVVDEELLSGPVGLAHDHIHATLPDAVAGTELAVGIALGMALAILLPEQEQRHAFAPQLPMNDIKVGLDQPALGGAPTRLEQPSLQLTRTQTLRQRPRQPGRLGAIQVLRHRCSPDPERTGDLPYRSPGTPFQPQHIFDFSHG